MRLTRGVGGPVPAIAHPQLYMRSMTESDLPTARALLSSSGRTAACMLPVTPEFASGEEVISAVAASWTAVVSEFPRDGLLVVRCRREQVAAQLAVAGAGVETEPQGQNGEEREEGPVVGVVSLRCSTHSGGGGSVEVEGNRDQTMVHTIDCLVCDAVLATT